MSEPIYRVLFVCTGNSARSIPAEALFDHWGTGRFNGYSAGMYPKCAVHPRSRRCRGYRGGAAEGLSRGAVSAGDPHQAVYRVADHKLDRLALRRRVDDISRQRAAIPQEIA